jgi:hypothetical protein
VLVITGVGSILVPKLLFRENFSAYRSISTAPLGGIILLYIWHIRHGAGWLLLGIVSIIAFVRGIVTAAKVIAENKKTAAANAECEALIQSGKAHGEAGEYDQANAAFYPLAVNSPLTACVW